MSTINTIQSTTLSVELKIRDMQETYNVLEEHSIQVRKYFPEIEIIRRIWRLRNL